MPQSLTKETEAGRPTDERRFLTVSREATVQENQGFDEYLLQKAKVQILQEFLRGDLTAEEILDINRNIISIADSEEAYQVVLYDRYRLEQQDSHDQFSQLLRLSKGNQRNYLFLNVEHYNVLLLKGEFTIRRLESMLHKYSEDINLRKFSPLDSYFLSCGRMVERMADIPDSYRDAVLQMHRRFFCDRSQHFIRFLARETQPSFSEEESYQDFEKLEEYTRKSVILIQTYNRDKIASMLEELRAYLGQAEVSVPALKNWLLDLYLGIKEKISGFYKESDIPFISNSGAIQYILSSKYLYEIIDFLSAQFEMIMRSTGNFTRDSIIDVILNYIDHNYSENITLDSISPIFGYNSSYLGKIFTEKAGISFHAYLDQVRIEKAKELLLHSALQVYRVASQVGYANVDYFHIKFKKHTGYSPAAYRKEFMG